MFSDYIDDRHQSSYRGSPSKYILPHCSPFFATSSFALSATSVVGATMSDFISPSASYFNCSSPENVVNNFFNLPKYRCAPQFFDDSTPKLPLAVGLGIVLAFGLSFGLSTLAIVYFDHYMYRRTMNSEYFNTAGRSIRTGLTASVIVSQWTWASTLLESSNVAFLYGVSGPLWYASGAAVQVVLFSVIAVLVKLRAPSAHTFLEIIKARWGGTAHRVFLCFAVLTNLIDTSMLILGGSATVSALTGINVDLASFLIPLGVIMYTLAGGLKATFVASYFNTVIIFIALFVFAFNVFFSSHELGSSDEVWDRLQKVAGIRGVEGNKEGSYITVLSQHGFFFGLVNLVGNFGRVFVDQAYWQSAIAATPTASWRGYLLGGICWFAIPFSLATSLGLAAVALSLPISLEEANSGLVPLAAAEHLMGTPGATLMIIMLFMAVTSSGAAEQIAFSSIISYDVYRAYINPNCSGQQIIGLSRVMILAFGLLSGGLGIVLNHVAVNLNFLFLAMGIFVGPAVVPVAYSISWERASGTGAVLGAVSGLVSGISVWLGFASTYEDGITIANLERDTVMLAGNMTAIIVSAVVCSLFSLVYPDNCDWSSTRAISLVEDDPCAFIRFEEEEALVRALQRISSVGVVTAFILFVLWPVLTLPFGVFTKGYFRFWVLLSFVWVILAGVVMTVLPVYESRHGILAVISAHKLGKRSQESGAEADSNIEDFRIDDR